MGKVRKKFQEIKSKTNLADLLYTAKCKKLERLCSSVLFTLKCLGLLEDQLEYYDEIFKEIYICVSNFSKYFKNA